MIVNKVASVLPIRNLVSQINGQLHLTFNVLKKFIFQQNNKCYLYVILKLLRKFKKNRARYRIFISVFIITFSMKPILFFSVQHIKLQETESYFFYFNSVHVFF